MKLLRNCTIFILSISILTMLSLASWQQGSSLISNSLPIKLTINADSPIYIDGNGNFTDYGFSGTGDVGTPYLIQDLIINASGDSAHGIYIANTTAYFIIQNCTITNADTGFSGIRLENVTHGKIMNNTMVYNSHGIYVWNSNNNTICDNNVTNNLGTGLNGH